MARARVCGRAATVRAVIASQIFVKTMGLPGIWRDFRVRARSFWEDIVELVDGEKDEDRWRDVGIRTGSKKGSRDTLRCNVKSNAYNVEPT